MRKIVVFTATRAERGLLEPVLTRINENEELNLMLAELNRVSSLTQLIDELHYTQRLILEEKPDIVVVPTDRMEMLAPALTCFYSNVPCFHFLGGTYGTGIQDEITRFIISKCSHIVFCEDEEAKKALISLGEDPWRCIVVGITHFDDLKIDESVVPKEPYDLFLIHPDTYSQDNTRRDVEKAISLLDKHTIVIEPNKDVFYNVILDAIKNLPYPVYGHFPRPQFLALLKNCERFITNSSTEFYEAQYFGTKCIHIGNRNKNRKPVKIMTGASSNILNVLTTIPIDDKLLRKRYAHGQMQKLW